MHPRRTFRRAGIAIMIPCLALLTACPFDPPGGGKVVIVKSDYLPRITITNVLQNLKTAYERKNLNEYLTLLTDDFTYEFDPQDVIAEDNIPDSGVWGLADERISADNMFNNQMNSEGYRAEKILLDFAPGAAVPSDKDPSWRKVVLSQVNLSIDSVHAEKGTLTYLVQGDQAILHFVQTEEVDPDSQQKLWRIAYWEDKPIGLLAGI